jgi:tetratricopeptide (TPR) repeat protein
MDRTRDLIRRGQYQAATLLLPALAALGPELPWQAEIESEIACAQKQFAKVIAITEAALDRWPTSVPLLATRSEAAMACGDRVGACVAAADAVMSDPQSVHAKVLLGRALRALGKTEQAAICFREALNQNPNDLDVRRMMAEAAPSEAIALLREGVEIEATNIDIRNALIRCLLDQNHIEAAGVAAAEAIELGIANATTRLFAIEAAGRNLEWTKAAALCDETAVRMGLDG